MAGSIETGGGSTMSCELVEEVDEALGAAGFHQALRRGGGAEEPEELRHRSARRR